MTSRPVIPPATYKNVNNNNQKTSSSQHPAILHPKPSVRSVANALHKKNKFLASIRDPSSKSKTSKKVSLSEYFSYHVLFSHYLRCLTMLNRILKKQLVNRKLRFLARACSESIGEVSILVGHSFIFFFMTVMM